MPKPYAIATCCDAKYGDFLLNHWLKSLQHNVNLKQIDVVVLDYGLTGEQRAQLHARQVVTVPCRKDGSVVLLRIRDVIPLFRERGYQKVLSVDGGDVIFQADISDVFAHPCDRPALVAEEIRTPFFEALIQHDDIRPELLAEVLGVVRNKPILNSGVVLGTAEVFQRYWDECRRVCHSFKCYGTDQLILNYLAYRDGHYTLNGKYNYVIVASRTPFYIRDGEFYFRDSSKIHVVHDAGGKNWIRVIANFGYGPMHNQRKTLRPLLNRVGMSFLNAWHRLKLKAG